MIHRIHGPWPHQPEMRDAGPSVLPLIWQTGIQRWYVGMANLCSCNPTAQHEFFRCQLKTRKIVEAAARYSIIKPGALLCSISTYTHSIWPTATKLLAWGHLQVLADMPTIRLWKHLKGPCFDASQCFGVFGTAKIRWVLRNHGKNLMYDSLLAWDLNPFHNHLQSCYFVVPKLRDSVGWSALKCAVWPLHLSTLLQTNLATRIGNLRPAVSVTSGMIG